MKKIAVLIISLIIVTTIGFAATVDSDTLQVFGMISANPESFIVTQTNINRINLIAEAAVQPSGTGVVIGNWVFSAYNASVSTAYKVTYTYSPMVYDTTSIAYEVLEINGSVVTVRNTGAEFAWTAPAGSSSVTRGIGVRLTTAGAATAAGAPASEDYTSTITIALVTP